MKSILRPCPFCGGTPEVQRMDEWGMFYIVCENCGGQVYSDLPDYVEEFSMKDLIAKWNRRSADDHK